MLGTLGSSVKAARHTAAQAVSAMATIDLPHNQWPELIQGLTTNVTHAPNGFVKQSSLEALGYICEEIDPDVLQPQSNLILTAVIQATATSENRPTPHLPRCAPARGLAGATPGAAPALSGCRRCRRHPRLSPPSLA